MPEEKSLAIGLEQDTKSSFEKMRASPRLYNPDNPDSYELTSASLELKTGKHHECYPLVSFLRTRVYLSKNERGQKIENTTRNYTCSDFNGAIALSDRGCTKDHFAKRFGEGSRHDKHLRYRQAPDHFGANNPKRRW